MLLDDKYFVNKSLIRRVILHWTAGAYRPNALDKVHYHILIDGDCNLHFNGKPFSEYLAHTLNCNTGSVGIAVCGMRGAIQGQTNGDNPIHLRQVDTMCRVAAEVLFRSGLVTNGDSPPPARYVLCHSEVESVLGIKQRQKWDIDVLPWINFKPAEVHRYIRLTIQNYIKVLDDKTISAR